MFQTSSSYYSDDLGFFKQSSEILNLHFSKIRERGESRQMYLDGVFLSFTPKICLQYRGLVLFINQDRKEI